MESENIGRPSTEYWVSSMATSPTNVLDRNTSCGGNSEVQSTLGTACIYEERFRVDRRKMEQLIIGAHDCADSAEAFFNSIMDDTNTVIAWPYRLKMGAKSRKDPYVRISGTIGDVKKAKEMVKTMLDTRESRAILKLDISYTDHSHIIGKGGQTIQRVMEVTGCHIHFPDSNRNNAHDKSNQVSISGKTEWVERARHQLRMLTPLVFSFELPMKNPVHTPLDQTYPIILMVQERYNVHVNFRKGSKLFSHTVIVKGSELERAKVEEATAVLIRHLCDMSEGDALVQMTMEITPNHHLIVRGYGNYNLKMIMKQTSTSIIFPDAADPNLPPLKKSTVTICGSIHNVYLARQRLVGSLPLMLMFDMEEEYDVTPQRLNELMNQYEVEISMRLKPKYRLYSVCIKGVERNAGNIYEARKKILNSNEPSLIPDIPATYFPLDHSHQPLGGSDHKLLTEGVIPSTLLPVPSPASVFTDSSENTYSNDKFLQTSVVVSYHSSDLKPGMSSLSHQTGNAEINTPENIPVGSEIVHSLTNQACLAENHYKEEHSCASSTANSLPSPTRSSTNSTRFISMPGVDSGYGDTCDYESVRPSSSPVVESDQDMSKLQIEPFQSMYPDYQSIKHLANKARQVQPDASKYRIPNIQWSGYGFSYSMPESALKLNIPQAEMDTSTMVGHDKSQFLFQFEDKIDTVCAPEYSSASMDLMVGSRRLKEDISDVNSLLEVIGLEKYAHFFTSQEIDMTTFMTLNDNDLKQLGISTFGARRKIVMAISGLKKNKNNFRGDAAPGAERKTANSSCWDNYLH